MDWTVLLISVFFGLGLTSCSHAALVPREYHHVNLPMKWTDAQHYCRLKHTDLATIESMEDASRLNRPSSISSWIWIGLTDDPKSWKGIMGNDANSWRWSATGGTSITGYQNWQPGQPDDYNYDQACVIMQSNGRWNDIDCLTRLYFVCYDQHLTDQKVYTLIKTHLTWTDAQTYCRTHHTDLAMMENDEENSRLSSVIPPYNVWTGLYRVLWRWSDKSSSSFRNWQSGKMDGNNYCAAENSQHQWNDLHCNTELTFWCHGALKVKMTVVRVKIQTNADLSNPATNTQILQQLAAAQKDQGWTDFKLGWKIPPRKQEKLTEPQCILNL
ncbi:macrophage mannose receptor 1-like [Cebidichthys violaceus]|uniref:macrophage mannose receptor 1-like n=1 Tax=Cebidichthys violaceus TaxID=271503 RepID=UPI0035C9F20B